MLAATTNILYQPANIIFANRSSKLKPLKASLLVGFSSRSSLFYGGFVSRTMTEMVKASAFKSGRSSSSNVEEDVGVLEQESLIGGSSQLVPAGLEPTLNRLSKWIVSALFGAVVLWRHDAEALWALMGAVVNAILSITLKRTLNQERPDPISRSDPGMPSSHAQSIFFIVNYFVLSIVESLGLNEVSVVISGLALAFGSYISWLRVSQRLHTISQVVVGAVVGFSFSILWFLSWKAFLLEAFVSDLWVRITVVLGAAVFCLGFIVYVIRYWFRNER